MSLACWLFAHMLFFFVLVRLVIINHCNPVVSSSLVSKCLQCGGLAIGSVLCGLGFHTNATTPGLDPVNVPGTRAYQEWKIGYSYTTQQAGIDAHAYEMLFGRKPICFPGTKIADGESCRIAVEWKLKSEVNGAVPSMFRPFSVSEVEKMQALKELKEMGRDIDSTSIKKNP